MDNPVETLEPNADETTAEDSTTEAVDNSATETSQSDPLQDADKDEFDELEVDGEKLSLPKRLAEKLNAERLMHADYTKKTMSLAEERKAAEADRDAIKAEREAVAEERKLNQSLVRLAGQKEHLAASYQQLESINLFELNQQDPVKAQEVLIQKQQIANAYRQVDGQLTQEQQKLAEREQQDFAKSAQQAASYLAREIKGWEPDNAVDQAITKYVMDCGVKDKSVGKFIAKIPQIGVWADKARQFDALMKQKETPKPKPAPQEAPVTRISASQGTATKDPTKMSPEEFAKWRKSTIQRRR